MKNINIINLLFISFFHLGYMALFPLYLIYFDWSWTAFVGGLILYILAGLGVTIGYHRFFSHKSFDTNTPIKILLLLIGTLSIESSALKWSHDHRVHHSHTDTEKDPYNIKKGFWHAHMGWIFQKDKGIDPKLVPDLYKDKWVMWQHNNYISLALLTNIGSFILIALMSDWMSALVLALLGRVFFVHHCTFFINSLAHMIGSRTYSKEITAADNFVLALLTFGEGYHNYHHAFPNDYRNGVKWYHFDPSKWIISLFQKMNMASRLRLRDLLRIKGDLIRKDLHLIKDKMEELKSYTPEIRKNILDKFHRCADNFQSRHNDLMEQIELYKKEYMNSPKILQKLSKREIQKLQKELEQLWKQWTRLVKDFDGIHPLHHSH